MPDIVTPFTVLGKQLQYLGYFNLAFFISGISSFLYYLFDSQKTRTPFTIKEKILLIFVTTMYILSISYAFPIILSYLIIPIITIMELVFLIRQKRKININYKKMGVAVILLIVPILTGSIFYNLALSNANNLPTQSDKVLFLADYSLNHTYSVWSTFGTPLFRSNNDILSFYVLGFSACGELGYIERTMLNSIGVETREIILPGEDHEFNEVFINGSWYASDLGYPNMQLLTTQERGAARISEPDIGGLSLTEVIENNGTILWNTDSYVKTDTIILHISDNNVVCANNSITLSHKFQSTIINVNGFSLDNNGTVVFKMGNLQNFVNIEKCYWISVNGNPTGFNITSYGINTARSYSIDIGQNSSSCTVINNIS